MSPGISSNAEDFWDWFYFRSVEFETGREMQNRNICIVELNLGNESWNRKSGYERNRRQRAVFGEIFQVGGWLKQKCYLSYSGMCMVVCVSTCTVLKVLYLYHAVNLVIWCLAPQWNLTWMSGQRGKENMVWAKAYTGLLCFDNPGPLHVALFKLKQIA